MESKVYYTHFNGGRPFKVTVVGNEVTVQKRVKGTDEYLRTICKIVCEEVHVGTSPPSPATIYSGGYGPAFDGNSILLRLSSRWYRFIGNEIFDFPVNAPIVKFSSPVGNNDVPYPYARDAWGNYYLLTEDIVIAPNDKLVPCDKHIPMVGSIVLSPNCLDEDAPDKEAVMDALYRGKDELACDPTDSRNSEKTLAAIAQARAYFFVGEGDRICEVCAAVGHPHMTSVTLGPATVVGDPEDPYSRCRAPPQTFRHLSPNQPLRGRNAHQRWIRRG